MTPQPRVHISLNVADLPASLAFYQTLLGTAPSKVRNDYGKFEPPDLAINLALNPTDGATDSSRVSHFGIQVPTRDAVRDAGRRLRDAGLAAEVEEDVTCCYAVQDKVWVSDPDGNAWEIFAVTQSDTRQHSVRDGGPSFPCCPTDDAPCCA